MLRVQIDSVLHNLPTAVIVEWLTRVWVDVEPREVAARNVEANPVAPLENERRRIHLDRELVGLSGVQELGLAETVAVSSAHDAIGNIEIHTGQESRRWEDTRRQAWL